MSASNRSCPWYDVLANLPNRENLQVFRIHRRRSARPAVVLRPVLLQIGAQGLLPFVIDGGERALRGAVVETEELDHLGRCHREGEGDHPRGERQLLHSAKALRHRFLVAPQKRRGHVRRRRHVVLLQRNSLRLWTALSGAPADARRRPPSSERYWASGLPPHRKKSGGDPRKSGVPDQETARGARRGAGAETGRSADHPEAPRSSFCARDPTSSRRYFR